MGELRTGATVFLAAAFMGALVAAFTLGQFSPWAWVIGVAAGLVAVMLGAVYNIVFIKWPSFFLFSFALGGLLVVFLAGGLT